MEALVKLYDIHWIWSSMPGHAQHSPKQQDANIYGKAGVTLFISCM